jgi:mono/diheme cytochrome c family protein
MRSSKALRDWKVQPFGWPGSERRSLECTVLVLAGLLVGFAACAERTHRTAVAAAGEEGPGRILYLTYCQGCHGLGGRGDGPAAASLRTPPADLTQLWERYGIPLDRERLAEYIDGRRLVDPHGVREMPLWGREFFADAPPIERELVENEKRHLIEVLCAYLETLQSERQL